MSDTIRAIHNAYDGDGVRLPGRAETNQAFDCLAKLLGRYRLPYGTPERYRQADPDEFMLMDATCWGPAAMTYRFKHRDTRNYLHVQVWRDGLDLMVPSDGRPFRGGTFEVAP